MNIEKFIRPHFLKFRPYSSARSEFKGEGQAKIFLDANENPFETAYNRYPDPLQKSLKAALSDIKGVSSEQIFLGNGSDEAIDLIIRLFCEPQDVITILPPTYGMYQVAAETSNIALQQIPLTEDFQLDVPAILAKPTKLLFICSPNNPTGNAMPLDQVESILQQYPGIVVVDEAYIDFSSVPSCLSLIDTYPNLIVLQTLSKAWGMANIRLGMAFANVQTIHFLSAIKPPYNVNGVTQNIALERLRETARFKAEVALLLAERDRICTQLEYAAVVQKVYPSDANFLLFKVEDAVALHSFLVHHQVVVRNRHTVHMCEGCIRVTVGTSEENDAFLSALQAYEASK